jgi:hypothetical protein
MQPATQKIGRYEVIDELGRGAMGVVYRARDTQIGRVVALKVILTANTSPKDVEHYKQRFAREAQAAGRLSHPGIVTIHDIAEDEAGQPYLVMEFVEGQPLDVFLESHPQAPLDQLLDIGIQVAQALDFAHQNGVVHRDIKPANILLTRDRRAKIADFGIAKLAGMEMTQEGTSLGTPSYMSPEQFRGTLVDARSDQFSLGAVLFWMCAGQKPFAGDTVTAISFQVVFEPPPRMAYLKHGLPPDLEVILLRSLAKHPEDRYASCGELAADLEALKAGRRIRARQAAAPAASKPLERTQATPVSTGPEKTRLASTMSRTAAQVHIRPASRTILLAGIAAVLLLAMVGGAYWWGFRAAEVILPAPAAPVASAPATSPHPAGAEPSSTTAPAEKEKEPARIEKPVARSEKPAARSEKPPARTEKPVIPTAFATLRMECKHNFRSATLEVYVDGELLFRTALRGKEHNYGVMKVYEGKLDAQRPIPVGSHSLRVWVVSHRDDYDDQEAVEGEFTEGRTRTLEIEFGKGSAIVGRKLDLTLH